MRFFKDADYKFIEKRKKAYVVSALVTGAGILAMIANFFLIGNWQDYGVDFTGGSLIQVGFEQPITAEEIRGALEGVGSPDVTAFEGDNEFVIRAPQLEEMGIEEVRATVAEQLAAAFGEGSFSISRMELVGPKIGEELQQKAALAILFSFVLTLIYLAIRFEFRFGVAAVIATVHDILVTLGFLAAFRVEIVLPTVAAILTIVGYSLNDTIVVFDRVRENLRSKGGRREDPIDLLNRSINEVLPRTVLTSGTTLAVLLALLFLGPVVIRDFAIVLILGVVIGTYSSVFVASPALLEIQERWGEGKLPEKRRKKKATAAV